MKKDHLTVDKKDHYYLRNVIGISGTEFLWGFGTPVMFESTFIQLFLRNLGASSFLVGLVPALFFVGLSVFALFAGYFTSHLPRKRTVVILTHLYSGVIPLIFGLLLFFMDQVTLIILIFFISYALFSISIGFTAPIWQNYLVKIFSEKKAFSGISIMMISQSMAKLVSSFLVAKIVSRYSFSTASCGVIFTAVGMFFIAGAFMFLLTKEIADENENNIRHPSFFTHFRHSLAEVVKNRNFLYFLGSDLELFAVINIISFYANYATEYCGIEPAVAAGLFVASNYTGAIMINILLGWIGLFKLKNKYIFSRIISFSAIIILVLWQSLWAFLLVSFLLGCSRSIRMLAYPPAVKKLSGLADATNYFSVAPILTLPLSAGISLMNGRFLDHFAVWGAFSYKLMFMGMALLVVISLFFIIKTDFSN